MKLRQTILVLLIDVQQGFWMKNIGSVTEAIQNTEAIYYFPSCNS